jgi:hypothetical protein
MGGRPVPVYLFLRLRSHTSLLLPSLTKSLAGQPVQHVLTSFIREVRRD